MPECQVAEQFCPPTWSQAAFVPVDSPRYAFACWMTHAGDWTGGGSHPCWSLRPLPRHQPQCPLGQLARLGTPSCSTSTPTQQGGPQRWCWEVPVQHPGPCAVGSYRVQSPPPPLFNIYRKLLGEVTWGVGGGDCQYTGGGASAPSFPLGTQEAVEVRGCCLEEGRMNGGSPAWDVRGAGPGLMPCPDQSRLCGKGSPGSRSPESRVKAVPEASAAWMGGSIAALSGWP